jgi:hypothetical protein
MPVGLPLQGQDPMSGGGITECHTVGDHAGTPHLGHAPT